jgi:hypothetical protein
MNRVYKLVALGLALASAAAFVAFPAVMAFAQDVTVNASDNSNVVIPWGNWLSQFASAIAMLTIPVVGWLFRKLPEQWAGMLIGARVDQLLAKAIDYGINSVAEASKNKTMSAPIANEVLRSALQYAVDNAPNLVKMAGGVDLVIQKIIARLDTSEGVGVVAGPAIAATAGKAMPLFTDGK